MALTNEWWTRLAEQRALLRNSLDRFYAGDEVEALRIATSIRVLVHETQRSTPLLKLVDRTYADLQIADSAQRMPIAEDDLRKDMVLLPVAWTTDISRGFVPIAALDGAPRIRLQDWWNGIAFVFASPDGNLVFRRRDLVLMLANKEGGAHVDPEGLPPRYREMFTDNPATAGRDGTVLAVYDTARTFVAQSGAELHQLLVEIEKRNEGKTHRE